MLQKPEEVRGLTYNLAVSVWTAGAIGALFEAGLVEHLRDPVTAEDLAPRCRGLSRSQIERCLAVAAAAGVVVADGSSYRLAEGALPFVQQPMRNSLLGDLRTNLMQALALLDAARGDAPQIGWQHTERALLQSQGDASGGLVPAMKGMILPALGDLASRLERPGSRFLDVGVGVAALSIAICRAFPAIEVVGLDVREAPLAAARENVAKAGLESRIVLRQCAVQELRDEARYDLAWLPSFFVPSSVIADGISRVRAALRPGGWLLLGTDSSGNDRERAVFSLISELWGGAGLSAEGAESLLRESGFVSIRTLPGPSWAPTMIVGQAPA
jgi:2-polyprenyl-3-methyl-5-hydroxy-6-metoxy-1,4-benzoquinol methylase